ncbi:MAG TPA: FAD-binding oxidoreductase [Candidatus Binataceae bacterium]|nr:FAD-binding oxidoreductase [Candidatus Binataceae bacterium]
MNRREFLKVAGSAALLPMLPLPLLADTSVRRCRPGDPSWPSKAAWDQLNKAVGGNLITVDFPISILKTDPSSDAAKELWKNLKNPFFVGDQVGLTESLGWVDAWTSQPSVYAVAARNASDIAAAVNFARQNNLRLVVKGGGHSYHGTSNAPDSLLVWTRHMNDIAMHPSFVPQGCEGKIAPQPAVTLGAGTIWMQAYQAVTTKGGKYVQGGGCTTVGVAGLVSSGGFGSYSKHYGTVAANLLEAEVVTADGQIRIANACNNPDLFWALKGGGGGNFGVISKVTVRVHDLPEFVGVANFKIKADSDDAYRRLIRQFVSFYKESLLNDHWGEQIHVRPDNIFEVSMVSQGLSSDEARKIWQPFLDWLKNSSSDYSIQGHLTIGSIPGQRWWDVQWWKEHWAELPFPNPNDSMFTSLVDKTLSHLVEQPLFVIDKRPGAAPSNAWWQGDAGQVSWFMWGMQSLWLPESLLEPDSQQRFADALFAASRHSYLELHLNKGLAGAPPDVIERTRDTATNPAVLTAFTLAITGDAQQPAYPGIPGHEPNIEEGRKAAARIEKCLNELRAVVPEPGAYVSESNYFEKDFPNAYWGSNRQRLADVKKKYDPDGLFFVHNGVGSEAWSRDGFTKL